MATRNPSGKPKPVSLNAVAAKAYRALLAIDKTGSKESFFAPDARKVVQKAVGKRAFAKAMAMLKSRGLVVASKTGKKTGERFAYKVTRKPFDESAIERHRRKRRTKATTAKKPVSGSKSAASPFTGVAIDEHALASRIKNGDTIGKLLKEFQEIHEAYWKLRKEAVDALFNQGLNIIIDGAAIRIEPL